MEARGWDGGGRRTVNLERSAQRARGGRCTWQLCGENGGGGGAVTKNEAQVAINKFAGLTSDFKKKQKKFVHVRDVNNNKIIIILKKTNREIQSKGRSAM